MGHGIDCQFLYGPQTEEDSKTKIEEALREKSELKLEVQFYKMNGAWASKPITCD
jgi:potassium voltage-gated channel Eag-related subfamily H protein 8